MSTDAVGATQSASRFLALPAELRLLVYEFLYPRGTIQTSSRALPLLLTCKVIRAEASALALPLANLVLSEKAVRKLQHCLDVLPRTLAASIRHVTVEGTLWGTLLRIWDPQILPLGTLTATTIRTGLEKKEQLRLQMQTLNNNF